MSKFKDVLSYSSLITTMFLTIESDLNSYSFLLISNILNITIIILLIMIIIIYGNTKN